VHELLDGFYGSYLRRENPLADTGPRDRVHFAVERRSDLALFLRSAEAAPFASALQETIDLIDGFETPLGMELLATLDWLISRENCLATEDGVLAGLARWPTGPGATRRKLRIFDQRMIHALRRLVPWQQRLSADALPPNATLSTSPPAA
jgi:hypothetical protein